MSSSQLEALAHGHHYSEEIKDLMAVPGGSEASSSDFCTILSAVQEYAAHDGLHSLQPLHPYASNPELTLNMLRNLITTTSDIASSLNAQVTLPFSNPKLLSLLRQQTSISHTVHSTTETVRQTVAILRKRAGILYGEDIPLDRTLLLDWFISRLKAWGTSAGMESFKEDETDGRIAVTLGGKVIVVDINIFVDRTDPFRPKINLTSLKTSYAVLNGAAGGTTSGSISLDGFLTDCLRVFLAQIQLEEEAQDPEEVARIGTRIADDLKYLMTLDQLALREGEQGLRWFHNMDTLSVQAEDVAAREAESVARSVSSTSAPLDIFLMRAHALPLPYVAIPSISFLVYLSPLAYLTLRRTCPNDVPPLSNTALPVLDIPFQHLRACMATRPRPPGATISTLVISKEGPALPAQTSTMSMEALAARPTFILHEAGAKVDAVFSLPLDPPGAVATYRWFLDFTDGGKHAGVVMSQSRMREIETIVNPLGTGFSPVDAMPLLGFASGSWVDLLIGSNGHVSPDHYTALYTSPSNAHPPLKLRLAAPEEPGFHLEKVPVRNLKEVWGILEVVREQCWLNEIISSVSWEPDVPHPDDGGPLMGPEGTGNEVDATEAELQAVLEGTNTPAQIPVNVHIPTTIPSTAPDDDLFESADIDSIGLTQHTDHRATKIVLRAPEPPPVFGMFEISVEYDCARPRGVALSMSGAFSADVDIDSSEEVCRRGGLFGLPGKIWMKLHSKS